MKTMMKDRNINDLILEIMRRAESGLYTRALTNYNPDRPASEDTCIILQGRQLYEFSRFRVSPFETIVRGGKLGYADNDTIKYIKMSGEEIPIWLTMGATEWINETHMGVTQGIIPAFDSPGLLDDVRSTLSGEARRVDRALKRDLDRIMHERLSYFQ